MQKTSLRQLDHLFPLLNLFIVIGKAVRTKQSNKAELTSSRSIPHPFYIFQFASHIRFPNLYLVRLSDLETHLIKSQSSWSFHFTCKLRITTCLNIDFGMSLWGLPFNWPISSSEIALLNIICWVYATFLFYLVPKGHTQITEWRGYTEGKIYNSNETQII